MKRLSILTLVLLVLASVVTVNAVQAEKPLAQDSIEVRVTIPSIQKMEIVEPIENTALTTADSSGNQTGTGKVRVVSNSDWKLEVNNTGLNISVRYSGDSNWSQQINGSKGSHLVEVKVENTGSFTGVDSSLFTLSEI